MSNFPLSLLACILMSAALTAYLAKNYSRMKTGNKISYSGCLLGLIIVSIIIAYNQFVLGTNTSSATISGIVFVFIMPGIFAQYSENFINFKPTQDLNLTPQKVLVEICNKSRQYFLAATSMHFIMGIIVGMLIISIGTHNLKYHFILFICFVIFMLRIWTEKDYLNLRRNVSGVVLKCTSISVIALVLCLLLYYLFNFEIWQIYLSSIPVLLLIVYFAMTNFKNFEESLE